MAQRKDEYRFKRNDKVVAAVDLPGIPAGTPGKVWIVNGFTWVRYHVEFELPDGTKVERSSLHNDWLMGRDEWATREAARAREARLAARSAQTV